MIAKKLIFFFMSWLVVPLPLQAHHSPAMFDGSKQLTLTGTVRLFQWTNPHSYIQLIVKTDEWSGAGMEPRDGRQCLSLQPRLATFDREGGRYAHGHRRSRCATDNRVVCWWKPRLPMARRSEGIHE